MQDQTVSEWTFYSNEAEEQTAKEWLRLWMQCFLRKIPADWSYSDKEWIHKDATADANAVIGLKLYFKIPPQMPAPEMPVTDHL